MFPPTLFAPFIFTFVFQTLFHAHSVVAVQISVPNKAPTTNVVQPNFLGISFELSFMDEYFGNDTSTIPPTMINYLSAIRSRTGTSHLRVRVGGNSMDSSTYVPSQKSPMVQLTNSTANANNQPVNYGPELWNVMKKVADEVGGTQYLIGLSLLDPNNANVPILAAAAAQGLNDTLDGYLLGNEPDLYTSHGNRPNIANYTVDDYIGEFRTVTEHLTNTSAGNLLELKNIGGPTICCSWDLNTLLLGGYLNAFNSILKYISLQHYPQNNCFGSHAFDVPYYVQHANVVNLASWNKPGIDTTVANTSANHPLLIMSEFNSASCGGVPGVSDTFAVGSLWTVDYALQMAAIGYSAAYLHTRERGITYNLFTPPEGADGNSGPWVTNPPYYALIAAAEVLNSPDSDSSIVVDLDIGGSKTNKNATTAGYAIYDTNGSTIQQFALFNYGSSPTPETFELPSSAFSQGNRSNITVKYLSAQSDKEQTNIAWGGESLVGAGDGKFKSDTSQWAVPNKVFDCTNGCTIDVPSTALAVVFVRGVSEPAKTTPGGSTSTSTSGNDNKSNAQGRTATIFTAVTTSCFIFLSVLLLL